MEGAGGSYNIALALRLEGELDVEGLERALQDVVERHEALRTVFPEEEGVAYQKVLEGEEARLRLERESITEAELSERLREGAGVGMELERELPLRAWLYAIRERESTHVLLLVLHHIAGDGWSLGPLGGDVEKAYRARREGREPEWERLGVQYRDYAEWQRELLGRDEDRESVMHGQLEYWRKTLGGMPEELQLPADRPRPGVMSYRGGTVALELDAELHGGLRRVGRESGASLFMVLAAGLSAVGWLMIAPGRRYGRMSRVGCGRVSDGRVFGGC